MRSRLFVKSLLVSTDSLSQNPAMSEISDSVGNSWPSHDSYKLNVRMTLIISIPSLSVFVETLVSFEMLRLIFGPF